MATLKIYPSPESIYCNIIEYDKKQYPFSNYANLGRIVGAHLDGTDPITNYSAYTTGYKQPENSL